MADSRDSFVLETAQQLGLLTAGQIEEARKLKSVFADNGVIMTLPEIILKKEWLSPEQVRALNILMRYEDLRTDDQKFGDFMIQKGFVSEAKVRECLESQRKPYEDGKNFPRLHELLLQKKYITPQQLQIMYRARVQINPAKVAPKSGSGTLPAIRVPISNNPPAAAAPPPVKKMPPPEKKPAPAAVGDLSVEGCTITLRKTKQKDAQGRDCEIGILDAVGVIDGHSFKPVDDYLGGLTAQGLHHLILNFDKIEYLSSAGIGVLAGAIKRCRDSGGDLRLCNVQDKVKKIINLVGLQSMLRMYDQERGAVLSFKYL